MDTSDPSSTPGAHEPTQRMRRAVADAAGPPEALVLRVLPLPVPGAGQVLIEVEAAGVASGDVMTRQGTLPATFPYSPGYDVVGHVRALGPGAADLTVGQRVAAYVGVGGCATAALAGADLCVPVPEDLPAPQLAALVLNYTTAWQMLHRVADVPPGGSVLVLGAAGGVGSALVELALLEGLSVLGTASASRRALLSERGVIALADATGVTDPVDATFDAVGGSSVARSRRATKRGGVVVSYGVSGAGGSGASKARAIGGLLLALARARLSPGARVRHYAISRTTKSHPEHFGADLMHLVGLLGQGRLAPRVTVMGLEEVVEAHRRLQSRQVEGKLVLVP